MLQSILTNNIKLKIRKLSASSRALDVNVYIKISECGVLTGCLVGRGVVLNPKA
jgi:hypothetical protein